jgi:hypothetical protein
MKHTLRISALLLAVLAGGSAGALPVGGAHAATTGSPSATSAASATSAVSVDLPTVGSSSTTAHPMEHGIW